MRLSPCKKRNKKGQTLVEYASILAFISVIVISLLISFGDTVRGDTSTIDSQLQKTQASH